MPRDAVSRTAHVGTVGKNGLNTPHAVFENAPRAVKGVPREPWLACTTKIALLRDH